MLKTILLSIGFSILTFTVNFAQVVPNEEIKTLEGRSINIHSFAENGKITILSFWATWCTPCKKELDAFADLYEEWVDKYDLEIVAVTIDNARQLSKVKPMIAQKGWEFTILSDSKQALQAAMNFQTIPQTFLIDKKGNIVYTHNGYAPGDEYHLEDEIKKIK